MGTEWNVQCTFADGRKQSRVKISNGDTQGALRKTVKQRCSDDLKKEIQYVIHDFT